MSNNQVVISTLMNKRHQLIMERNSIVNKYDTEIGEIEDALDKLSGKSVWRPEKSEAYDDENPDYIKGTEDGI